MMFLQLGILLCDLRKFDEIQFLGVLRKDHLKDAWDVDDTVKWSHHFVTQGGRQLLWERVFHLTLLVLEELRDVAHDKHLYKLILSPDSLNLNL